MITMIKPKKSDTLSDNANKPWLAAVHFFSTSQRAVVMWSWWTWIKGWSKSEKPDVTRSSVSNPPLSVLCFSNVFLSHLLQCVAPYRHTPMYPSPTDSRPALWQFGPVFSQYGLKCHHKSPLSPVQYIDVTKWSIALPHSTTNTVFKALSLSFFSITTPFPALSCSLSPPRLPPLPL